MKAFILSTFVVILAISVSTVFSEDFTLDATGVVTVNQYYDAVWSPDGNNIAVTAAGNPDVEKGQVDVLIVPVDGSKPVNLTGDIDDWCRNQQFTYDSSEVAFTRLFIGDERITGENIEAVNIKTGEHRIVMEDASNPAFSNDGRYLAFIRYYDYSTDHMSGSRPKIVLYDLLEKKATDLFKFTYAVPPSIHFSPDNTHIITYITSVDSEILSQQGKRNGIVLIPLDGSDPELVPTDSYHINFPAYSPDGKWIVYTQFEHDLDLTPTRENDWGITSIDIVLYETDTGRSMKLSEYFEVYNSNASFSPNGSQICYTLDFGVDGLIYISDFKPEYYFKAVNVDIMAPEGFGITGNYPNPFNPTTTIEFSLPEAGFAHLAIYNIMGQKIRELVSGNLDSGVHNVVWDGRDDSKSFVSSGTYISRLKSGEQVTAKQMMLLK